MGVVNEKNICKAFAESLAANDGTLRKVGGGIVGWYGRLNKDGEGLYEAIIWHDGHGLCVTASRRCRSDERAIALLTHEVVYLYRYRLWPKKPSESIRGWYMRACPTDELGPDLVDVPFYKYYADAVRGGSFYVDGVDDSVVRQRLQDALRHVMDACCDIHDVWEE